MNIRCPHCRLAVEIIDEREVEIVTCPSCKSKISVQELLSIDGGMDDTGELTTRLYPMPLAGDSIAHFVIEETVGLGGFGSVFAAQDTRLNRRVALKIPRHDKISQWHAESFIREAQAAAQLRHPNIVSVHEIGRDGDRVYIVSDLIEGLTLGEWISKAQPTERDIAKVVAKTARAIHNAHEKGVIHRDLKPRNIIIDAEQEPHITDFGLAKRDDPDEITITVDGHVIGTPAYMSPEQAEGKSQLADRRTDVYSLGVVLFEAICGRRPFVGESDLLINEIIAGDPVPPHSIKQTVSRDVEAICLKAMSVKPSHRFPTALELAEDLERFVDGQPTLTRPRTLLHRALHSTRKHWRAMSMTGCLLALLFVSIYAWNISSRPAAFAPELNIKFDTIPPRSDVVVYRIDELDGSPIWNQPVAAKPGAAGEFTIDLVPGEYLVRAALPNFGVQEVYREVPENTRKRRITGVGFGTESSTTKWERVDDENLRWQPIEITKIEPAANGLFRLGHPIENMVKVSGGSFELGTDSPLVAGIQSLIPNSTVVVKDFLISQTEISIATFHEVMGYTPNPLFEEFGDRKPDDVPVTHVSVLECMIFCERVGGRLPTYEEYSYLATNRGTTKYPWSDEEKPLTDLLSGSLTIGLPDFDRTPTTPPIFNLYSGVGEWTARRFVPIDHKTGQRDSWPDLVLTRMKQTRMVCGLPLEHLSNVSGQKQILGPRQFELIQLSAQRPDIGFRVARSLD